jgi:hypothetical protein
MKILLIVPCAVVSLFVAACEQKSAQITSSSPAPSSTSTQVAEAPDYSGLTSPSVAESSPVSQVASSPSPNASAGGLVFKTEAATQAANKYLDNYEALIRDVNEVPPVRPVPPQPGAILDVRPYLQKLVRDSAELANQQKQIDTQLTSEEKKRLRQYQKGVEQAAQDAN